MEDRSDNMLTVFGLLLVCLKAYFNLHRGDRHNLICAIRTHAHIEVRQDAGQRGGLRTLCARRTVSAPTSEIPI